MSANRQLDLFVALIGDVPFRDEREAMSAPLVSLSKNKRTRIEWEGPSGQKVLVTAPDEYGVATIWDYDVLLWAISQINEAVNAGLAVSPKIEFHPYNGSSSICVSRSDRASQIEGIRPWYRRSIGLQPPAWRLVRSASLRRVHGSYLADWLRMASALSAGRLHGNDMVGGTGGSRTFPLKAKRFGSSSGFVDGDV